jgi:acyl dehydratase
MPLNPSVGDRLPTLSKAPDREALVKYAAGGGDFNPLHFDTEFPQVKEIGDNIVHGRLKYAAMGECVSNWLGHAGWIRSISAQYRGMDMVNAAFSCDGEVTAVVEEADSAGDIQRVATVSLWTTGTSGSKTTVGEAQVVLAS